MSYSGAVWQRSTFCADGACVEVAFMVDHVAIRDSKNADGSILVFGYDEWDEFIARQSSESPQFD
jgi:hypothetical protein